MFIEGRAETPTEESKGKILVFGPLSSTLGDLSDQGYYLSVSGGSYPRHGHFSVRVYLNKGSERYFLGKMSRSDYMTGKNLCSVVRSGKQLIEKCRSGPQDPWEPLTKKYPKKPKNVFVGNRTLREYLQDNLV